jgi:hypothetical protein
MPDMLRESMSSRDERMDALALEEVDEEHDERWRLS